MTALAQKGRMSGMELLRGSQDVESDSVFGLHCLDAPHVCENAQNSQVTGGKKLLCKFQQRKS